MAVLIHFAGRNAEGNITHVGGVGPNQTSWQLSISETIALIESGEWQFFTQAPVNSIALVKVKSSAVGNKYLVTTADGVRDDNLDYLPILSSPVGGAYPPWPINLVSYLDAARLLVNRVRYMDRVKKRLVEVFPTSRPSTSVGGQLEWTVDLANTGRQHRTIVADLRFPYPARNIVYASAAPTSGLVKQLLYFTADQLTPTKRDELDKAEAPYFTWEFGPSALDNGGPFRMTEIRFSVTLSQAYWDQPSFRIWIGFTTLNPVDLNVLKSPQGQGTSLSFINLGTSAGPQPLAETRVILPNVLGLSLGKARAALSALGVSVLGQSADITQPFAMDSWIVTSESPPAGTSVGVKSTVWINASPPTARNSIGIKRLRVSNQYAQQRELTVWTRNVEQAEWKNEGVAAFGGTLDIEFDDDTYALYFQDTTLIGCNPNPDQPSDPCIYKGPVGLFPGDSNGKDDVYVIS